MCCLLIGCGPGIHSTDDYGIASSSLYVLFDKGRLIENAHDLQVAINWEILPQCSKPNCLQGVVPTLISESVKAKIDKHGFQIPLYSNQPSWAHQYDDQDLFAYGYLVLFDDLNRNQKFDVVQSNTDPQDWIQMTTSFADLESGAITQLLVYSQGQTSSEIWNFFQSLGCEVTPGSSLLELQSTELGTPCQVTPLDELSHALTAYYIGNDTDIQKQLMCEPKRTSDEKVFPDRLPKDYYCRSNNMIEFSNGSGFCRDSRLDLNDLPGSTPDWWPCEDTDALPTPWISPALPKRSVQSRYTFTRPTY